MIVVTLACGHSRSLDDNTGEAIGVGHICYCTIHKTNSRIVSMNAPPKPRPPRFVVDSMLSCVLQMMQDVQQINNTGDTWENILARAKVRLYDDLDAAAGPPRYDNPAPPPQPENPEPYWFKEYERLFRALESIRDRLGLEPDSANGLDLQGVVGEVNNLMGRIHRLQAMVTPKPRAMGQFEALGPDWNSVVYHIGQLVKVNWRGEKP